LKVLQVSLQIDEIFFAKPFTRLSDADNKTRNIDDFPRYYQPLPFELADILIAGSIKMPSK
jgi:hypothetical protein